MTVLDEMFNEVKNEQPTIENTAENTNAEINTAENTSTQETQENPEETTLENNTASEVTEQQNQAVNQFSQPISQENVFANEELAEANAFLKKNPGKTFADYQALKVPTSSLNENDLIKSYLSEKEGKTEAAIAYELKRLELKQSDPDFDDEFSDEDSLETLKLKADRDELILKAREWREGYVKEQLNFSNDNQENTEVVNENQLAAKSIDEFLQDAKRVQEEYTQNYRTKIYEAVGNIDQIPLTINGQEVLFVPDENFRTDMRQGAEDVSGIGKEFFDEQGNITNASSFIKENTLWANPKTRQPMIDFMMEQAVLQDRASRDKGQRNITLDDKQPHSIEEVSRSGDFVVGMLNKGRTTF